MEKSTAAATALITLIKSIREGKLCTSKLISQGHLSLFLYNQILIIVKSSEYNITISFSAQALTCYCIGQYCNQHPSNSNSNNRNYENSIRDDEFEDYTSQNNSSSHFSSCEAKKGAKCFSAVTQVEDIDTGELVPER